MPRIGQLFYVRGDYKENAGGIMKTRHRTTRRFGPGHAPVDWAWWLLCVGEQFALIDRHSLQAALASRRAHADLYAALALRLCRWHYGDDVAVRRLLRILIVECGPWFAGKQAPVVEFAPP